jgi:hypothetical protein
VSQQYRLFLKKAIGKMGIEAEKYIKRVPEVF